HGEAEMVEPLIGRRRRGVDAIARVDRGDENIGAAELDVDATGTAHDLAAQDVAQPRRSRLGIGAAQMYVVPGELYHRALPCVLHALPMVAAQFSGAHVAWPSSGPLAGAAILPWRYGT